MNKQNTCLGNRDDYTVIKEFDVRERPCSERFQQVFGTFQSLQPGHAFIFTNDCDTQPLYHKMQETGTPFEWYYLRKDPGDWRIMVIRK